MSKKQLLWAAFAAVAITLAVIQFVPGPPLVVPAQLPPEQRAEHRLLNFEGIDNFRDLGGYRTADGRTVKWGVLYRSGNLAGATPADLRGLKSLHLSALVDFRSGDEKAAEPDRLPPDHAFEVVDIPTLDSGEGKNPLAQEIMRRMEEGDFDGFDPNAMMIEGNRAFATVFTPNFRQFIATVQAANGQPVLWHCTAGKDRAGFAAAILLRILGVDQDTILSDYMLSKRYSLASHRSELRMVRLFKGDETADTLTVLMGVEEPWLQAGFDEIDAHWGSFDAYARDGLGLDADDIEALRDNLLTGPAGSTEG